MYTLLLIYYVTFSGVSTSTAQQQYKDIESCTKAKSQIYEEMSRSRYSQILVLQCLKGEK